MLNTRTMIVQPNYYYVHSLYIVFILVCILYISHIKISNQTYRILSTIYSFIFSEFILFSTFIHL